MFARVGSDAEDSADILSVVGSGSGIGPEGSRSGVGRAFKCRRFRLNSPDGVSTT